MGPDRFIPAERNGRFVETDRIFVAPIQEVIDARVYVGIHYRNSDTTAAAQGRSVANWVFRHTLLPLDRPGNNAE